WHWDNFSVAPARPLAIVPAAPRWAVATDDQPTVSLSAPAPKGARLRFAAVGTIDYSYDDGRTWTRAVRQPEASHTPEHYSSYLVPLPAGQRTVRFRGGPD